MRGIRNWSGDAWRDPAGESCRRKSKLLRDAGLSQHRVGGVTGKDFPVHEEMPFRDRAVPDFMVTLARPLKVTSVRTENLLYAWV